MEKAVISHPVLTNLCILNNGHYLIAFPLYKLAKSNRLGAEILHRPFDNAVELEHKHPLGMKRHLGKLEYIGIRNEVAGPKASMSIWKGNADLLNLEAKVEEVKLERV